MTNLGRPKVDVMPEILSPDVLIKLSATTLIVVVATIMAERAGPFVAAMIAALPISAGPGYLIIAMEHGADAVSKSALTGVGVNAITAVFLGVSVLLIPRFGIVTTIIVAVSIWIAGALIVLQSTLDLVGSLILNLMIFPLALRMTKSKQFASSPIRIRLRFFDIALRATCVACVVSTVLLVGRYFGPATAGLIALTPVVWVNIAIILYSRIGAIACVSVLSSGVLAMAGYCFALTFLHLAATRLSLPIGLSVALVISVCWNFGLVIFRKRSEVI